VPTQAGTRFCRCPGCGADEQDNPLEWTLERPETLACRFCKASFPKEGDPAKVGNEIPEEVVEVVPGVVHRYPYHVLEPRFCRYPEERVYLKAKFDYESRKFLAKAAFYASLEATNENPSRRSPEFANLACVILLRFAQVYPRYALHFDQPGQPKYFQPATPAGPLRRKYQTAKWEWSGCLEVPLNLLAAYARLRDHPALAKAGEILEDPDPRRTIEEDLFRAAARFASIQPEEFSEQSIEVYRGLAAAGEVLGDNDLIRESRFRIDEFTRRGFYHDGFWKDADAVVHRRVLKALDDLLGKPSAKLSLNAHASLPHQPDLLGASHAASILHLARSARVATVTRSFDPELLPASWPSEPDPSLPRHPALLGGAGFARLTTGDRDRALDLELRGPGSLSGPRFDRLALRLSVAGRPVLDDLDELGRISSGWDRSTASHNTVLVDGLNQRETPRTASEPAVGSDVLFFAADADFQVVRFDDPRAYPHSTTRYRQTLIASSSPSSCYAVSIFEVVGGLQHDQIFHAAAGSEQLWRLSIPTSRPPASLLPGSIAYVSGPEVSKSRWFVQCLGDFHLLSQAVLGRPAQAWLSAGSGESSSGSAKRAQRPSDALKLHLLGDRPLTAFTATSPVPAARHTQAKPRPGAQERGSLILRRRSIDGETLRSVFVTLFEPVGPGFPPLRRVGRVSASGDCVVLRIDTSEGTEFLLVNLEPGSIQTVQVAEGRYVSTDGLALRVNGGGLVLAGGSFAEGAGHLVTNRRFTGTIVATVRQPSDRGRGWFETDDPIPPDDATIAGRTLIVQHGDGPCRAWTLTSVEKTLRGTRLHVYEEPGFTVEPETQKARYYQHPQITGPPPHRYWLCQLARAAILKKTERKN